MATREQIEALRIDENIFELAEDTELEYLVHFAAPFTGQTSVWFPKERPLHHIHRCEAMPCICNSKHSHSNIAMVVQHDFWKFPRFTSYCLCFMAVLRSLGLKGRFLGQAKRSKVERLGKNLPKSLVCYNLFPYLWLCRSYSHSEKLK